TNGTQRKSYKDPILQSRTQALHLQAWLQDAGWHIPIFPLVVSTNQYAIVKNVDNHEDFTNHFITLENLPYKLEECFSTYKDILLQPTDIHTLARLLHSHHRPATSSLMQTLHLQDHHFLKGVVCHKCEMASLKKVSRGWHCPHCEYKGEADLKRVILDYFLLHQKEYITNQKCREILGIESHNTAYYHLKSMGFTSIGENKGRKYYAPAIDSFPQHATPKQFEYSVFNF